MDDNWKWCVGGGTHSKCSYPVNVNKFLEGGGSGEGLKDFYTSERGGRKYARFGSEFEFLSSSWTS